MGVFRDGAEFPQGVFLCLFEAKSRGVESRMLTRAGRCG